MKITRREFGGFCAAGALARAYAQPAAHRQAIDLDGAWQFSTDGKTFNRSITVPGAWQSQRVGEPAGILRHQYESAATYRRTVRVPESWRGKTMSLRVGGAHRITTAFVNGIEVGGHDGFSAPFSFDVSRALRPGADNDIVVRIENPPFTIDASPDKQVPRFPTGMLNYIANWGGIYGEVALEAAPETRVESVLIIPSVRERIVTFQVNAGGGDAVHVTVPGVPPQTSQLSAGSATVRVPAVQLPLWTPDQPRVPWRCSTSVRGCPGRPPSGSPSRRCLWPSLLRGRHRVRRQGRNQDVERFQGSEGSHQRRLH